MNCNCFRENAERLFELGTYDDKKIEDVEEPNQIWTFGTNAGANGRLSYEEFELTLEGLKRPKKVKIAHKYCPFCGVKAGKLDESIEDNNPLDI